MSSENSLSSTQCGLGGSILNFMQQTQFEYTFIPLSENTPAVDYGFLKVPNCSNCGAWISTLDKISNGQRWDCHICSRRNPLPDWYSEKPISYEQYAVVCNKPKVFTRRVVFLIDITSAVLCQMVLPLIYQSLNSFDEVAFVACTPLPSIFQYRGEKLQIVTLVEDCEYSLQSFPFFLDVEKDYLKIKRILKQIEILSNYHQAIFSNNNSIRHQLGIVQRLAPFKGVKVLHLVWQKEGQFSVPIMSNYKNHYQLFLVKDSESVDVNGFAEIASMLNGRCQVYESTNLDLFYDELSEYLASRINAWECSIRVFGAKIASGESVQEQVWVPYMCSGLDHTLKLQGQDIESFQIVVSYQSKENQIFVIHNIQNN